MKEDGSITVFCAIALYHMIEYLSLISECSDDFSA